jgi:L-cysteine/cystine lyase
MDVEAIRAQIPATREVIYLNTGWAGPMPRPVMEAIGQTFQRESLGGPTAPPLLEQRLQMLQRARAAVAELLGATAEEISLQQNTTEGINIVLNGLDLSPGDELITCNMEHSSVIVPCYYARDRRGLNLRIVELDREDSPEQILDKFARAMSPRTRLFVLSHVSYSYGLALPLREINRLAHAGGALVLGDGAQAVGQMPVNVVDLECDFYCIPGHKWLLGPAGTGALYVRRDLIERLPPPKVAHRAAQEFDHAGHYQPRTDAIDKYELTTTSIPLWVGLTKAIGFLRSLGLEAILERARSLARRMMVVLAQIPNARLVSPSPGETATALLAVAVDPLAPQDVTAALWEMGRIVSRTVYENGSTRLSMDFFNTEEEVDQTLALIRRLARDGLPPSLTARQEAVLPAADKELDAFWDL